MDSSPLSLLPPELQDSILQHALINPQTLTIPHQNPEEEATAPFLPALAATCTDLRARCYKIFFGNNTFHFEIRDCDARRLVKFVEVFGEWVEFGGVEVSLVGMSSPGGWMRCVVFGGCVADLIVQAYDQIGVN